MAGPLAQGDAAAECGSTGRGRPPIDPRELEPILDAVMRVAARKGSHKVTMRAVADEADVSVGRLQHHFGSRDGLVESAFQHYLLQVTARLHALRTQPGTVEERLELLIDEIALRHSWRRSTIWIDLLHRSVSAADFRRAANAVQDAWMRLFTELIEEGIDAGAFAPTLDATATARQFVAVSDGFVIGLVLAGESNAETQALERQRLLREAAVSLLRMPTT